MSKKVRITRSIGAAAAVAAASALVLPGIASAADATVPAPKISATTDGDVIDMTLTQTSKGQSVMCVPLVLDAESALPLAATAPDQWPNFVELLGSVYYIGTPTSDAAPTSESTTGAAEGEVNPDLLKPITPGAYAVVGACVDADPNKQDKILSYSYQIVFSPGGVGSLGQALGLGSATLKTDGAAKIIANLLTSGAGSSMLSGALS